MAEVAGQTFTEVIENDTRATSPVHGTHRKQELMGQERTQDAPAEYPDWSGEMSETLEAMKRALEALETNVPYYLRDRGYAPISDLRAAIEELSKQSEPVAHMYPHALEKFQKQETFMERFTK